MKLVHIILIVFIAFFASSCASKKEEVKSAVESYKQALKTLNDKRYSEAAEKFEGIYDDYPSSKWSIKGGNMAVYAYYKDKKYEDVIRVADTFIDLNPAGEYVPYLQYMKSISYFNMIPNVNRGQDYTELASYAFRELAARFPNSDYAADAKDKINIIDERLAGAKMSIGHYQLKNDNYVGAMLHFSDVVDRYDHTKQAPEAYFRLYEIYYKLGMKDQAQIFKKELKNRHGDSPFAKKSIIK